MEGNMLNTKLILLEGIPGSGKSTLSGRIHEYLTTRNIKTSLYLEGCDHPVDLPFYAYLTYKEFDHIIIEFPQQAESIREFVIIENDYILVPYKSPAIVPCNNDLLNYLRSKEVCYTSNPIISFHTFSEVFHNRFERYTEKSVISDDITIFESVLFQHQLHDIMRMYHIDKDKIINYLHSISQIIGRLNPVLFYISQNSVRESLIRTALVRSKPKWASEESITFCEKRKNIELEAIEKLPINTYIIDNSDYNWDKVFDEIIRILSIETN